MKPNNTIDGRTRLEAVVGVFDSAADACRVAALLRGPDLKLQNVSRTDSIVPSGTPEIDYFEIDEDVEEKLMNGVLTGGAVGAGSGLLLLGIPVLNVAAPIIGAMVGAWIGAIAGIDESNRANEIPNEKDYHRMLTEGKSFVVITGDEAKRIEYGNKMTELGASEVHQHSSVQHLFWD